MNLAVGANGFVRPSLHTFIDGDIKYIIAIAYFRNFSANSRYSMMTGLALTY